MFHRRLPREKMYFKRKFIAVPYLGRQIVLSDTKSTDPLCMFEICEYSYIYMTIYIEHMTYNRIKDKGSTLCADFEHSIFLCCTEKKSLKSEKGEISLHRTIFPHLFGHSTLLNLLALLLSVWYCKKLT